MLLQHTNDEYIFVIKDNIQKGQGHGGWQPLSQSKDPEPWLQVDFPRPVNVKGVITQVTNSNYINKVFILQNKFRFLFKTSKKIKILKKSLM